MRFLRRGDDPNTFATTMIGVKLGDRVLQVGCGDGALLAALAGKAGLTGRACGVDDSEDVLARAQGAADRAGVLVELQRSSHSSLPFDPGSFDVAVLRDALAHLAPGARAAVATDAVRVLRPGGRCIVVDTAPRGGLAGLLAGRKPADPSYKPEELVRSAGCKAVRTLAEREGLRLVEGVVGR
jgi:ubiquinone/menaquinone biosynthesis C-methylase UbiE